MSYVKIVAGQKTFKMETPSSFSEFQTRLSKKLGCPPLDHYDISYVDSEQQSVGVVCEDDFKLALTHAAHPLRFQFRPLAEADASNEDIFRLSNLCEYIVKIEDEIESVSTKLSEGSPFAAPLVLTQFAAFAGAGMARGEGSGQEASPSVRRETAKLGESENPIEASILSFLNLFVLSKLKAFVLDQFRDICAKTVSDGTKKDPNSTKSTVAMNMSDFSGKCILVDHYIPPPEDPVAPNIFRTEARPIRLTNLQAAKGKLTRGR